MSELPMSPLRPKPRPRARPKPSEPVNLGFAEHLALFLHALHRNEAPGLLENLAAGPRAQAQRFWERLAASDSATRQAYLAREFGVAAVARERIKALLSTTPPALSAAIARHVHGRRASAASALCPAMDAFAARLVREALREG